MNDYYEVTFSISPLDLGIELLPEFLADYHFESFEQTASGLKAYIQTQHFNEQNISIVIEQLSPFGISVQYEKKIIPHQNWNKIWESNFQPIVIDNKCFVRAAFHPKPQQSYPYEIIVTPQMSFGTGHHQTTYLMLKAMLEMNFNQKAVLDMGCGTGILGILAAKMGAKQVDAIDIEDWTVENANDNFKNNNLNNAIAKHGDITLLDKQMYDVVLANINKNVLLADLQHYAHHIKQGGFLLISGFYETDQQDLINEAHKHNFLPVKKMLKDNWVQITLKKQ